MEKKVIIYDDLAVIAVMDYEEGSIVATNNNYLVASIGMAKIMLEAAGIDCSRLEE